jgi:hypothetical protein
MSKKKPKPDSRNAVLRIQLPPQRRRREPAADGEKQPLFADVPGVQQPLFDKGADR